jgi:hypothetical protein
MEKCSDQTRFWDTIAHTFQNSMPSKSPKPRFEHYPINGMKDRIASYCSSCKDFIAASHKQELLKIAENAHNCPAIKRHP